MPSSNMLRDLGIMIIGLGIGLYTLNQIKVGATYLTLMLPPFGNTCLQETCLGFNGIYPLSISILNPDYSIVDVYEIYFANGYCNYKDIYQLEKFSINSNTLTTINVCGGNYRVVLMWGNISTNAPANVIVGSCLYTPPGKGIQQYILYNACNQTLYWQTSADGIYFSIDKMSKLPQYVYYNFAQGEVLAITDEKNIDFYVFDKGILRFMGSNNGQINFPCVYLIS